MSKLFFSQWFDIKLYGGAVYTACGLCDGNFYTQFGDCIEGSRVEHLQEAFPPQPGDTDENTNK